ncbi:MAG: hypothetical protein ACJZ40_02645 [Candidatus Poseidoniaceae archaeon]
MPRVQMIPTYFHMRSLKLPADDANRIRGDLRQNIDVTVELGDERQLGSLKNGLNIVTKFAWVLNRLEIQKNGFVEYELIEDDDQWVIRIIPGQEDVGGREEVEEEEEFDTVWNRKRLKGIRIRTFDFNPEWTPENETDVYLAFAKIEEYTDFVYCQGMSSHFARRLAYGWTEGTSKPDAILMHSGSEEYYIAEFKIYSNAFKGNHHKDDVDVLVCWIDNEDDRDVLPPTVIELQTVVREVARQRLME